MKSLTVETQTKPGIGQRDLGHVNSGREYLPISSRQREEALEVHF